MIYKSKEENHQAKEKKGGKYVPPKAQRATLSLERPNPFFQKAYYLIIERRNHMNKKKLVFCAKKNSFDPKKKSRRKNSFRSHDSKILDRV